jgi:glycosyltransferase involved in cell wall biosynthesis
VSGRDGPLRLCVLLDRMERGGAEQALLDLCRHLDPARVSPRFLCLKETGALTDDVVAAGLRIDALDRNGRFDPTTLPRMVRLFRRERIDAVLIPHHPRAALTLGRLGARLAGVPATAVAVHGMDMVGEGGRCLPRHDVETLFLSDALVTLSSRQGRYLHEHEGVGRYPWRSIAEVVIPNGVPVPPPSTSEDRARARRTLGLDDGDVAIGIVARLASEKAHDVLFAAFARLAQGARLVVIGGGPLDGSLRGLAGELGIADRVTFTGQRGDVPQLLPGLDVLALSSAREAAPLAVLEGMAAGVPVVVTRCGLLPDMVADGEEGFVVDVGDGTGLAYRLGELVDDPDLRVRMGRRARARVEREFRIETTAAAYERLFDSLVGARTPAGAGHSG